MRRLLEIGEVREPPILVNLAAKDPYVKEQAAKVAKTQTLFELLVQDFLKLEELGVSRSQLRDATRICSSSRSRSCQPRTGSPLCTAWALW